MKIILLKLSEEIRKAFGRDFFEEDVCNNIIDTDLMIGSVKYEIYNEKENTDDEVYVEFNVEDIDCNNLTSDENIIEIKEVQTPKKHLLEKYDDSQFAIVKINYIPEFGWYEVDMDNAPLMYFDNLEEARGSLDLDAFIKE
ncbi:hypothetical protein LNAT_P0658 [Lebetimonas natsushimae]|uniref:Uncharacterized protein n=1 Tax=Lebetimonas natsushimae TaxID=1936991 RepID=A0A292YD76_9BACT|nr:hypothetical protein [Lebetimonas natsushimae]GAX87363.1 hypothetical protein LNAT_P0658 [Lebetimonas natsushimae]